MFVLHACLWLVECGFLESDCYGLVVYSFFKAGFLFLSDVDLCRTFKFNFDLESLLFGLLLAGIRLLEFIELCILLEKLTL